MPPEQHTPEIAKKVPYPLIITAAVALLLIGFMIYSTRNWESVPTEFVRPETPPSVESEAPTTEAESLGGALYEKASNPLEDKLPEQSPVANPINDAYENPF